MCCYFARVVILSMFLFCLCCFLLLLCRCVIAAVCYCVCMCRQYGTPTKGTNGITRPGGRGHFGHEGLGEICEKEKEVESSKTKKKHPAKVGTI